MGPSSRRRSTQTANREKTERPSGENSKRFDPNDYVLPKSTTIIASVVLHAPGLSCVYYFNDSISVFFSAIVGSICEGVFFYLMLALLLKIYRQRAHAPKTRASKLGYWRDTFYRLPITLGIFLLLNALLVFPMGDYFLQNKSDGFTDFNVVASAFREASMMLTWVGKGQDRINDILQYVLVSFAAFGLSLMTFGYGVHLSASGKCRKKQCWNTNKRNVLNSGILTAIVYATGTWSPVFHCSVTMAVVLAVQVVGTNQPLITKFDNVRLSREIIQQAKMAPNVILLIHDSVSGPALLNTKEVSI